MSALTTHVLDTARGSPAAGVPVTLASADSPGSAIDQAMTDPDGRVADLGPERLDPGVYHLLFEVAEYFGEQEHFYPEVVIAFTVTDPEQHYHVPLLLSPFGYSTYRGS